MPSPLPSTASAPESAEAPRALRREEALVAEIRERFLKETAEHALDVLHDDGLYRHLRFKSPQTSMYYFDLITWPGYLTVSGDCGTFVFARTRDMLEFFAPAGGRGFDDERWGINPQYWAEKLQAPRHEGAQRYSPELFRARVLEWHTDVSEELEPDEAAALRQALEEQILAEHLYAHDEHEAHRLLEEFEHDGRRIYDSWEWDLREYDWSFLWCLWAIVWGIGRYRAETAESATPAPEVKPAL